MLVYGCVWLCMFVYFCMFMVVYGCVWLRMIVCVLSMSLYDCM